MFSFPVSVVTIHQGRGTLVAVEVGGVLGGGVTHVLDESALYRVPVAFPPVVIPRVFLWYAS